MTKLTMEQIKKRLQEDTVDQAFLSSLSDDSRVGVKKLLAQYHKHQVTLTKLYEELEIRQQYELALYQQGIQYIAGLDEVGRGPLAGPVVACAVILPMDVSALVGVNDSKTLSRAKRKEYEQRIKDVALVYEIIEIDTDVIDKVNILESTKLAMLKSVNNLSIKPQHLLIDALTISTDIAQTSIIKGDANSISIASASILAKEYRDARMEYYHTLYPEYGFNKHMGYGTKEHLDALNKYGKTPIHRESFAPVKAISKHYAI